MLKRRIQRKPRKRKEKVHPLLVSRGHKPRRGTVQKCTFCKIEFYRSPSRTKLYKQSFCSHKHLILWMKERAFSFDCPVYGKKVFTQPAQIKYRNRRTCSHKCNAVLKRKETLERHKKLTRGQANRLARRMPELVIWRKAVFERDNYTCQECGIHGGYLEADHIKPFAYFPELRLAIDNGRTLCRPCHDKTKISAKKMKMLYETQK